MRRRVELSVGRHRPRARVRGNRELPGLAVRGTAIGGPCPCLHGIDADTGAIVWQQGDAAPTFAPSAIVNGVGFSGSTTDFTLRAVDLETGRVLWSQPLAGGIAGGVAV